MINTTFNPTDWYMRMLTPLSPEMKLDLIGRLSASLRNTVILTTKQESKADNFFSSLSGAWDDGTSVEDEMRNIRESRTSNTTRNIDAF